MISIAFIFLILTITIGITYVFLIVRYTIGWYRLAEFKPDLKETLKDSEIIATIIIPARNEEANIELLLKDLCNQSVSHSLYEMIVVDDHSTDTTPYLVEAFIEKHPKCNIQFIQLRKDNQRSAYKKEAISRAVKKARGKLIITTDADCQLEEDWLKTLLLYHQKNHPKMIIGPVSFHNDASAFEKMQNLEFLSLISMTAGAIQLKKPIMCNGANLVYEKEAFDQVGGFGADQFSSGDDVFLMMKIRKHFGGESIHFLKSFPAIVYTEANKNLRDFIQQRTRWASKNKGYDINILFVSVTVYLFNLLVLTGLIGGFLNSKFWLITFPALLIKSIFEIPALLGITNFVKRKELFRYSFPMIFLYPVYIVLTGAMGVISSYQWKDRKIKK